MCFGRLKTIFPWNDIVGDVTLGQCDLVDMGLQVCFTPHAGIRYRSEAYRAAKYNSSLVRGY